MDSVQQVMTGGEFACEADAWLHFDAIIVACEGFKLCREVRGEYLQPRLCSDEKTARIDRILLPRAKAIDAGWVDGPIGIEGKRSGMKAGKVVAQAIDYSRCVWELDHGFMCVLKWVFVWPLDNPKCDLESLMAQNRIGYITAYNRGIRFGCGGTNGIIIGEDGSIIAKKLPMGNKRGSR